MYRGQHRSGRVLPYMEGGPALSRVLKLTTTGVVVEVGGGMCRWVTVRGMGRQGGKPSAANCINL